MFHFLLIYKNILNEAYKNIFTLIYVVIQHDKQASDAITLSWDKNFQSWPHISQYQPKDAQLSYLHQFEAD